MRWQLQSSQKKIRSIDSALALRERYTVPELARQSLVVACKRYRERKVRAPEDKGAR